MSATDEMMIASEQAASRFRGDLAAPPSRRVAVVTCMDARIDAYAVLGLAPGEAHVIRNAGGVITDDVLRSLAISQRKLHTNEIVVMHHSGCGMASFTDAEFAAELEAACGTAPAWTAQAFTDAAEDVTDSVAVLRGCPYLLHRDAVRGFVLDIRTGRLAEIG